MKTKNDVQTGLDADKRGLGSAFGNMYRKFGILLVFVIMFAVAAAITPNFLKVDNIMNVVRQTSIIVILSCGMTMIILSGMIDLSAGFSVTLSGCLAAGVMVQTQNIVLSVAVGVMAGMFVGYICGWLVTGFNMLPFIATLAVSSVVNGVMQLYTGGTPITGLGTLSVLGKGYVGPVPIPVIIMFGALTVVWALLKYTKFGMYIYAIGGNEKASIASGINVKRMKRLIFAVHGVFVGLAGIILMARLNSGQPSVGAGYEFDAIIAVIIGGTSFSGGIGGVWGSLVGALIVGLITNVLLLHNVSTRYQLIVKGVLIAVAVILDTMTRGKEKN